MKDFFKNLCEEHFACGARWVIANEKDILINECFGYANKENEVETTEETVYRIASISKTIGAIGLMQLVEQGKLSLDDDISDILGFVVRNPNYPDLPITVRMITTQTSSILDGYDDEELDADIPAKGYNGVNGSNLECYLKDLLVPNDGPYYTPLTFGKYKPGEKFNYSNFGCGIMACLIEKASGEYFTDYMENHVFKPLGIDASFVASRVAAKDKIADMYQCYREDQTTIYNKERFINRPYNVWPLGENYRGPAGGLFINMNNLTKLMQLLMNKGSLNGVQILKPETFEEMYQFQWFGNPDDEYKAKSVQMRIYDKTKDFLYRGHTGGAYGVKSYMFFNLEHKIGAVFITNGFLATRPGHHADLVFEATLSKVKDVYTKEKEKSIIIDNNGITLEDRFIKYVSPKDENLVPLINLADAIDIIPFVSKKDSSVSLTKKDVTYVPKLINKNNCLYVDVFEVLNNLPLSNIKVTVK